MVSDSAEENIAVRNLYLQNGFKIVDCCKYPEIICFSGICALVSWMSILRAKRWWKYNIHRLKL